MVDVAPLRVLGPQMCTPLPTYKMVVPMTEETIQEDLKLLPSLPHRALLNREQTIVPESWPRDFGWGMREVGHKTDSLQYLPKGTGFIYNRAWRSLTLKAL